MTTFDSDLTPSATGDAVTLRPWIVFSSDGPACWQTDEQQMALALFSSQSAALRYVADCGLGDAATTQPPAEDLVRLFIMCKAGAIEAAVLDPNEHSARKLFDINEVLRSVRQTLRDGKMLD